MTARERLKPDAYGYAVNPKPVARLMQTMGLQAVYLSPRLRAPRCRTPNTGSTPICCAD